ncbi:MAG: hypothetical protein PSX81_05775 [bacterium]|nr:hypothetical protein [bacterium]
MPVSALKYYCTFGSPMPTRSWNDPNAKYKYGFNGKEKDNEINVDGGDYDFGSRIYDSRLGRWLALDPLMYEYPNLSTYNFANNSPIFLVDCDGKRILIHYIDCDGNPRTYPYKSKLMVPDNDFVKQAIVALDYDCKSRAGRRTIERAMKLVEDVNIIEYDPKNEDHNPTSKKVQSRMNTYMPYKLDKEDNLEMNAGQPIKVNQILWNPKVKMEILLDDGKTSAGGTQSAAVGVAHEIKHFVRSISRQWRYYWGQTSYSDNSKNKKYTKPEERRVIRWERRLVKQLGDGEMKRYNHFGRDIPNKNVTDHEGAHTTTSKNSE